MNNSNVLTNIVEKEGTGLKKMKCSKQGVCVPFPIYTKDKDYSSKIKNCKMVKPIYNFNPDIPSSKVQNMDETINQTSSIDLNQSLISSPLIAYKILNNKNINEVDQAVIAVHYLLHSTIKQHQLAALDFLITQLIECISNDTANSYAHQFIQHLYSSIHIVSIYCLIIKCTSSNSCFLTRGVDFIWYSLLIAVPYWIVNSVNTSTGHCFQLNLNYIEELVVLNLLQSIPTIEDSITLHETVSDEVCDEIREKLSKGGISFVKCLFSLNILGFILSNIIYTSEVTNYVLLLTLFSFIPNSGDTIMTNRAFLVAITIHLQSAALSQSNMNDLCLMYLIILQNIAQFCTEKCLISFHTKASQDISIIYEYCLGTLMETSVDSLTFTHSKYYAIACCINSYYKWCVKRKVVSLDFAVVYKGIKYGSLAVLDASMEHSIDTKQHIIKEVILFAGSTHLLTRITALNVLSSIMARSNSNWEGGISIKELVKLLRHLLYQVLTEHLCNESFNSLLSNESDSACIPSILLLASIRFSTTLATVCTEFTDYVASHLVLLCQRICGFTMRVLNNEISSTVLSVLLGRTRQKQNTALAPTITEIHSNKIHIEITALLETIHYFKMQSNKSQITIKPVQQVAFIAFYLTEVLKMESSYYNETLIPLLFGDQYPFLKLFYTLKTSETGEGLISPWYYASIVQIDPFHNDDSESTFNLEWLEWMFFSIMHGYIHLMDSCMYLKTYKNGSSLLYVHPIDLMLLFLTALLRSECVVENYKQTFDFIVENLSSLDLIIAKDPDAYQPCPVNMHYLNLFKQEIEVSIHIVNPFILSILKVILSSAITDSNTVINILDLFLSKPMILSEINADYTEFAEYAKVDIKTKYFTCSEILKLLELLRTAIHTHRDNTAVPEHFHEITELYLNNFIIEAVYSIYTNGLHGSYLTKFERKIISGFSFNRDKLQ